MFYLNLERNCLYYVSLSPGPTMGSGRAFYCVADSTVTRDGIESVTFIKEAVITVFPLMASALTVS